MTSCFAAALASVLVTPSFTDTSLPVKRLEATYRAARTMQVIFLEQYSENGRVIRTEAGAAYFRRPGKMRWEYQSPEKNLFLVDGKTAWFYVPGDHTVTRVPAKQSTDWRTPLALLAGEMKLSRICARVDLATDEKPDKDGDVVLSCPLKGSETAADPASKNGVAHAKRDLLLLEVAHDTNQLVRIVVREAGGVDIEFKFKYWQFDPPVPDSFFRFEVPPGVAIVNGELPSESKSLN
jgi:outer membrane lipoprotein carrier protein